MSPVLTFGILPRNARSAWPEIAKVGVSVRSHQGGRVGEVLREYRRRD